jgi:hypothetical protein
MPAGHKAERPNCPSCESDNTIRNGGNRSVCRDCGKSFTLKASKRKRAEIPGLPPIASKSRKPRKQRPAKVTRVAGQPRRVHYIVPDLQLRKGVPMEHLPWIGKDIARRKPDVVVLLGDIWDMPSLSFHDEPGSLSKEGARYEDDIAAGNEGLALLMEPVLEEISCTDWRPRLIFLEGNHEYRIQRTIESDPRYAGTIGLHHCNVERFGIERVPFLKVANVDGVHYSHYFQMAGSDRPIGGSMDNRLNKICGTFVQGHEQGLLQHRRPLPIGRTIHGIVAGSAYLHSEHYRGPQRNNEWRGVVVLHDVRNGGDCDPMPVTLQYLARHYGDVELHDFLADNYPNLPRGWAA